MIKNPETELLCRLLKTPELHLTSDTIDKIDWDSFCKLIIRHRLWYRFTKPLKIALQTSSKPQAQTFLSSLNRHCQRDLLQLMTLFYESVRLSNDFSKHQIKHALIKGVTLNNYLYGTLNTRPCRDIDLWVNAQTYEQASERLIIAGYIQKEPLYQLEGLKKTYHFKHRHDVAFYHPHKKILVELHFRLDYHGIQFFPFEDTPLKEIALGNKSAYTLNDDHHLLFLMIHAAVHGWNRLRWLEDIYLFVQLKQGHLDELCHLAKKIGCTHIVEQTLLLLKRFFQCGALNLEPYLQSVSKQAQSLYHIAEKIVLSDYEQIDGIKNPKLFFLYRYYFIKLAPKHKKIATVFSDMFKIYNTFSYFSFRDRFFWLYYVIYPYWVLKFVFSRHHK